MEQIRNFSIVAHIDHGKSTLADRLIQNTGAATDREFRDQVLDTMDIERERGITIKSQAITLHYTAKDGNEIQTQSDRHAGPRGFTYEVSRALASCEGVLLLVDASRAWRRRPSPTCTWPGAKPGDHSGHQQDRFAVGRSGPGQGRDRKRARPVRRGRGLCSAKEGTGVEDVLEAIVKKIPPPTGGDPKSRFQP